MWTEVEQYFADSPAQKKVALFLLRRGFRAGHRGVTCGEIKIPHTQIARELDVDRRAVDATVNRIQKNEKLSRIYNSLRSIAFLRDTAPALGLGVVVITPDDASRPGIISAVTGKISEHNISIRQAIADDPKFTDNPQLTIITDREITGEVLAELKKINGIKKITLYK